MNQVQTTLSAHAAWPQWADAPTKPPVVQAVKAKPSPKPMRAQAPKTKLINIGDLSLSESMERPPREAVKSKYDELFHGAMTTGRPVKAPPDKANAVAVMARSWLRRNKHKGYTVSYIANYLVDGVGDGLGRVWFLKPTPQKPN
jgi:hypothetical protein